MYKEGIFSKEENDFLIDNYKVMTYKEIGLKLNRKETSIHDRLKKLGLKKCNKDIWSQEEEDKLKEFYNKTVEVFDMFPGRSRASIAGKAHLLGLKKDNCGKFKVDFNFFKTWTEEMAYILGLICADGNLCSEEVKRLTITLHNNDLYMLEKINNIMKCNRPIAKRKTGCNDLVILNHVIYDDLIKLGVTPKKSLTLKWLENIPDDMLRHFVRGYIDGDGCISFYDRKRSGFRGKPDYIQKILEVAAIGTPDFLSGMSKAVAHNIFLKPKTPTKCGTKDKPNKAYKIRWTGSVAIELLEWIYKDANIYLFRKKEKYHQYLQDICPND